MKLYRILAGTAGKVISRDNKVQDWVVSKNLSFCDTQIDPVRLRNNPTSYNNELFVELAKQGYAIFVDMAKPKYYLAVPYSTVRILA